VAGGAACGAARPLAHTGMRELTFAFYSYSLMRVETPLMPGASRSSEAVGKGFWESVRRG